MMLSSPLTEEQTESMMNAKKSEGNGAQTIKSTKEKSSLQHKNRKLKIGNLKMQTWLLPATSAILRENIGRSEKKEARRIGGSIRHTKKLEKRRKGAQSRPIRAFDSSVASAKLPQECS